jgi:hypothetical protein
MTMATKKEYNSRCYFFFKSRHRLLRIFVFVVERRPKLRIRERDVRLRAKKNEPWFGVCGADFAISASALAIVGECQGCAKKPEPSSRIRLLAIAARGAITAAYANTFSMPMIVPLHTANNSPNPLHSPVNTRYPAYVAIATTKKPIFHLTIGPLTYSMNSTTTTQKNDARNCPLVFVSDRGVKPRTFDAVTSISRAAFDRLVDETDVRRRKNGRGVHVDEQVRHEQVLKAESVQQERTDADEPPQDDCVARQTQFQRADRDPKEFCGQFFARPVFFSR